MTETATFGEKINAMLGVIVNEPTKDAFLGKSIAHAMNYTDENYSRLRKKKTLPDPYRLGLLLQHLGIGDLVDYSVFEAPTCAELRTRLQAAGVGSAACLTFQKISQLLRQLQTRTAPSKLRLIQLPPAQRSISPVVQPTGDITLHPGQLVSIQVSFRTGRELVVLNERVNRKMALLKPSVFSPGVSTNSTVVDIPDPLNEPPLNAFPVSAERGQFRIYALWFDGSSDLVPALPNPDTERSWLSPFELNGLLGILETKSASLLSIATLEYRVI